MKETLELINRMQAEGVIGAYAIGGAVGATFYVEPMATMDVDVFVSFKNMDGPLIDLAPLYKWVRAHACEIRGEYVMMGGWPVQFLPPSDALGEEALIHAIDTTVDDVPTRVMTAEHLVAIALRVGRAKDHARILQFIEAGVIDGDRFDGILLRHGLQDAWAFFVERFVRNES